MRRIILSGIRKFFSKKDKIMTCKQCSIKYKGFEKKCPICGNKLTIYKGR